MWLELLDLKEVSKPMIVIGDSNEVLRPKEIKRSTPTTMGVKEFVDWVQQMNVTNLPLIDRKYYTWSRGDSHSRIDQMLIDPKWSLKFPYLKLSGLKRSILDNAPLLLKEGKVD